MVKREAVVVGLGDWVHPHSLRYTFATHQIKKGTNIRVIQEALGHEFLKTTSIYISLARKLIDKELQDHAL